MTVTIDAGETREVWQRQFGTRKFRSVLSRKGSQATERFGPFTFMLGLSAEGDTLRFPVLRAYLFGFIPLPRFLLPVSETTEAEDAEGRFTFDVRITLPGGGRVAHYRGWLLPEPECSTEGS